MWYPGSRLAAYKEQQRESKYKKKIMCLRVRAVFLVAFSFARLSLSHHHAPRRAGVPKWSTTTTTCTTTYL